MKNTLTNWSIYAGQSYVRVSKRV